MAAAFMYSGVPKAGAARDKAAIPIGRPARTNVGEDLRILPGEMLGADGGDGAGSHVGDGARVEDGAWRADLGIQQEEGCEFRGQVVLVVVDVVGHHLDAGPIYIAPDPAAQRIEMSDLAGLRFEEDAGLDDRLLVALREQAALDGVDDLVVR